MYSFRLLGYVLIHTKITWSWHVREPRGRQTGTKIARALERIAMANLVDDGNPYDSCGLLYRIQINITEK